MPKPVPRHGHIVRWMRRSIVVCAALAVAVVALFIQQLYVRVSTLEEKQAADTSRDMLIDAVTGLNVEPTVDPAAGRRFIPAARVVLPAMSPGGVHLYYRAGADESIVYAADATTQAQAISRMRAATSVQDVYREVAILQACSRQVVIAFNDTKPEAMGANEKVTQMSTKKLKDSRTATIYRDDACPYAANALLETVQQLDSL